jgi:hypothetical protein
MDIRLVIFYDTPDAYNVIEDDEDREVDEKLEEYVNTNINNLNSPGFVVENFEVPDSLERQLVLDICNGKSMCIWTTKSVDFYSELYLSWIFTNKEGVWKKF